MEPEPGHARPGTLHVIVVCLWVAVGAFLGLAGAAVVGTVRELDRLPTDPKVSEYLAEMGARAGPFFVAAVVALGAIATVEAILITLGHVTHVEHDLEEVMHPTGDPT